MRYGRLSYRQLKLDVAARDIIDVQAMRGRLRMHLMERRCFPASSVKPFKPASLRAVALCRKTIRS